ncbi:MAG: CRISPR-associated helicase Cas3 [uncultured Solirubrobacteraceae bacterium]|uniref:CRISPR-associated helicase Cas3 n=1 Tax=uncultured Solirubrobacteraceae bacterium TaxID=1162706 RepID=A0A6J4U3U2_9ACTN|nr:MAG: CRISPR-associated helicase Cas3 [uncultured Solirubrobacteraceae bacterium]
MRVLVLADREPRPSVGALLAAGGIDAIVGLGDLQPSWIDGVAEAALPKLGVYGNHDDGNYMPGLGMEDLHLRSTELGGLSFAGFEGCVRYRRDGAHQYTQAEAAVMAERLPPADVLVCHCPPAGINDDPDDPAHVGYEALRAWVDRVRPRYLLHGHTYPAPGRAVRRHGDTRVVHVAGARVVELEPSGSGGPSG